MEPVSIERREAFSVLGVQARIQPMTADYGRLWGEMFSPRAGEIGAASGDSACYGVYFATEEPGSVDFVAGMAAMKAVVPVPEGLVLRELPAAEYAVFQSSMSGIGNVWRGIYRDWLPKSAEYEEDPSATCFEYFPPGVYEGKALVSIFLPVRRKQG